MSGRAARGRDEAITDREACLIDAMQAVIGRGAEYGPPLLFCTGVAERWSRVFGVRVTARQVALALIEFKLARALAGHGGDSFVDIAGYAACAYEIQERAENDG